MTWALAAMSIIGVVLNIRHDRRCFVVWMFTNGSWAVVDAAHGIWGQAVLQTIYLALSIWGFIHWDDTDTDHTTHS